MNRAEMIEGDDSVKPGALGSQTCLLSAYGGRIAINIPDVTVCKSLEMCFVVARFLFTAVAILPHVFLWGTRSLISTKEFMFLST